MKEIEVIIDTTEIAEYFYQQLVKRGYILRKGELMELADITFDYLVHKKIIEEEINEES